MLLADADRVRMLIVRVELMLIVRVELMLIMKFITSWSTTAPSCSREPPNSPRPPRLIYRQREEGQFQIRVTCLDPKPKPKPDPKPNPKFNPTLNPNPYPGTNLFGGESSEQREGLRHGARG